MKKFLGVLLLCLIVFSSCGSTTNSGQEVAKEITEPVTIEIWHPFNGEIESVLQEITTDFNNQNDMVTVNLQSQGAYKDLLTKLTAAKGSNSLPVMSFSYSTWDSLWGSYEDLSKYNTIEGYELDFNNIVPAFFEEVQGENGEVYGMPYNKSTDVLFYNKELIKKAGITSAPKNIEELYSDAKKIKEETGVTGIGYDSLQNFLSTIMLSNDIPWKDDEGNFHFNDEKVQEDIQRFIDGINDGYARTAGEDGYFSAIMGSEKVAAYVGSSAGASYIDSSINGKFEWGAVPIPHNKATQQGTNIVVYNSATSEEKLAAWQYINYLYEDSNIVKFSLKTGYMPATLSSIETEEYQKAQLEDEVVKAMTDSIDKMEVSVPKFLGAGEIFGNNIPTTMSKILENKEDLATSLEELNKEAKAIYDRNN